MWPSASEKELQKRVGAAECTKSIVGKRQFYNKSQNLSIQMLCIIINGQNSTCIKCILDVICFNKDSKAIKHDLQRNKMMCWVILIVCLTDCLNGYFFVSGGPLGKRKTGTWIKCGEGKYPSILVDYWKKLKKIFWWSDTSVFKTKLESDSVKS